MGGGVLMEEFPHDYTYRGYPLGASRIPVYSPSFPGYWDDEWSTYYDNPMYRGNVDPIFLVEAPFTGDATSMAKKRKHNGVKGEVMSSGGHNVTRNLVKNGSKASAGASSSSSKPMRSCTVSSSDHTTTPARFPKSSQADAMKSNSSAASSVEKRGPHARVISIPVISADEGKDHIVNCAVIPQEGANESRKAPTMSAVVIQSWFRGYLVRKTAPLSQLRHIAKVKSQLKGLDQKAFDADFIKYARENSAAKVKMTESIMNLLLQLDAIQGSHPVVREFRKGATKEVINLQGRVDTLLSAEMAVVEPSQLPMEIEEESREEFDREDLTTPESRRNDSVATAFVDADKEEEHCSTGGAEFHPDQENGVVSTVEESLDQMEYEASKADDVEFNRNSDGLSTQMVEPDPDEGNSQVGGDEGSLEPIELVASKAVVIEISQSVADEMERIVSQHDEPTEAHKQHENYMGNESPSDSYHEEAQEKVEVGLVSIERTPEPVEVIAMEADTVIMSTNAERAVQSGNVSDVFPHDRLQTKEEGKREKLDVKINKKELHTAGNLSDPDDGDIIHPTNAKGDHTPVDSSLPYSPTSPFEATCCLDLSPSSCDRELQTELQGSPEIIQDAPAQTTADDRAMILKLSEENKALKSLLVTLMKWNQMQATAMQDVNHRLGKLESRISKKKSSSRRKAGKNSRMMF